MPRREPSLFALCFAAAIAATPLAAEEAPSKNVDKTLEKVQHAIEQDKARAADLERKSSQISHELEGLRGQMIDAAKATQEQEDQLTDLEGTLDELRAAENEKAQALQERRSQLGLTLAALERLALYPPEALAALPESPVDTVRSALLLRAAVPAVETEAGKLRADLDTMRGLRLQIGEQRTTIENAKKRLASDHKRLASLLDRKSKLFRETEAQRQSTEDRVARLTAQAKDLRDLMDRIEAERTARLEALARAKPVPPPSGVSPRPGLGEQKLASLPPGSAPAIRAMSGAQGRLTLPARGEIIKEFGSNEAFGATSKGITIRTRPDAQVVAPYDGQVVFAGPFRGYGEILIIEHSEGYHTLLSGLSRIDVVAGQWVLAGEPVGVMGPREGEGPGLYVELRRNGRPINPLPWLALHNGKVNG